MDRKQVKVGSICMGDGRVSVQSMLSTDTHDVQKCLTQIWALEKAGCQIVRLAVPDEAAVTTFGKIREQSPLPLVADIHFDYKLALGAVAAGADKIRINPGNIGSDEHVKAVANACRTAGIPIRVGVNSGSVEKGILAKYGHVCPEALCESALYSASLLERFDFDDIVISVKSSRVPEMVRCNRLLHQQCRYPLHIGVTEAGTLVNGIIKSSAGIGALLIDGIGDTIRVSLTADPVEEVRAAYKLLRALGLSERGVQIVSCPTCGRTKVDLVSLAQQVEERLADVDLPITVAVMGCIVNGPGEAREADIGLAGGTDEYLLFRSGEVLRKVSADRALDELMLEIKKMQEKE